MDKQSGVFINFSHPVCIIYYMFIFILDGIFGFLLKDIQCYLLLRTVNLSEAVDERYCIPIYGIDRLALRRMCMHLREKYTSRSILQSSRPHRK
jgi:hypothetical protein